MKARLKVLITEVRKLTFPKDKSDQSSQRFIYLSMTLLLALLGGVIYGYDVGVISGTFSIIVENYSLSIHQGQAVVSILFLGIIFGSIISGVVSDKKGRKIGILISLLLLLLGITMVFFSRDFFSLFLMRFVLGLGVGVLSVAIPLYITEVAPDSMRGRFLVAFQISITIGILLSYLVNYLFLSSANSSWKISYYLLYLPVILQLLLISFIPESPRWLISQGKKINFAFDVLKVINPEKNIDSLRSSNSAKNTSTNLYSSVFIKALMISGLIAILQQLIGINMFIQYLSSIFKLSGIDSSNYFGMVSIGIGVLNVIFTFISLLVVDRYGRKPLLILGLLGINFSLILLYISNIVLSPGTLLGWCTVIGISIFIIFYALGPGSVIWLLLSELFPQEFRGKGTAICLLLNSFAALGLSSFFLDIVARFNLSGAFLMFLISALSYYFLVVYYLPETKNSSLEDIQNKLK